MTSNMLDDFNDYMTKLNDGFRGGKGGLKGYFNELIEV